MRARFTALSKGQDFAVGHRVGGIFWNQTDIEKLPFASGTFDTVISCETIEHVPSPKTAVCELARVLKPAGRLFLSAPNYFGTLGICRGYMRLTGRRFTQVGQPINNFLLLPLVRSWVRGTGLSFQTVEAVGHYVPFPGRPEIRVPALDNPRALMKWFGHHSLIVASKLH